MEDWGLSVADWGLSVADWGLAVADWGLVGWDSVVGSVVVVWDPAAAVA